MSCSVDTVGAGYPLVVGRTGDGCESDSSDCEFENHVLVLSVTGLDECRTNTRTAHILYLRSGAGSKISPTRTTFAKAYVPNCENSARPLREKAMQNPITLSGEREAAEYGLPRLKFK